MKCIECQKDFTPRQKTQKYCSPRCGNRYRKSGKPYYNPMEQKSREFIKEMLNLSGNVLSIKVNEVKE